MPILAKRRLNGRPMGLLLPSGIAPSQISALTVGTVNSTSIAVSYGAASGTAPIRYFGWIAPHGSHAWTPCTAAFGPTGGTFTNLAPSTSYDLRVVASNAVGSSTVDLTTGIVTTSSAAGSFTIALSANSGIAGAPVTMTVTPVSGAWPSGAVVVPAASGLSGAFDNASLAATGTTPVSFAFSPTSGPGTSGALTATVAGMSNASGPQGYAVKAAASSGTANRFEMVMAASKVAAGTPVQLTITPNAAAPSGTITLSGTNGTFSPSATVAMSRGSSKPITVTYMPATSGEHAVTASNTASLYNPYPAPLSVFAATSGTARTMAAALTRSDMVTFQRDAASGNPAGFSLSWARGWGEVWLSISALDGATDGLWIRLYDAMSSGASASVGSGTALHASPVQVYGAVSGAGVVRCLLPAGPYIYYADVATDAAFSKPVRIAQRFRVGVVIGHFSRSQESGLSRGYAYSGNVPLPTTYTKTATWVGFDYRYPDNDSGWFMHDGAAADPYQYHYGEGSSSGAQEIGRLIESQLGVCVGIAGSSATGGGLDNMVNHDGSLAGGFPGSVASGVGSKFRYFWMATGGWDGVDGTNYPNETASENRARYVAAVDWIAKTYPACAVIGWVTGASGVFGSDGSRTLGYTRNQMILLNEIEPSNPMVVSKESYSWNEYYGGHATMGARVQYVRAGFRMLMAAELASFGGLQTADRGPRLASTGTLRSGSRVISIPYTLAGGAKLQPVGLSFTNPSFTIGDASATEIASLFAVYSAGGYQGNGTAIKIDGAAINTAASTIDLTLSGSSGITFADNTTAAMPPAFSVQFAADFGASNGAVSFGSNRAVMLADDRVDTSNGIPHGWHMRPALDIAISTV